MHVYRSSRGVAFEWRQGTTAPVIPPGTGKPRMRWLVYGRGMGRVQAVANARPAAGTSTSLTVADALHAHAADGITLTTSGSTSITVASADHAHSADAVVLTAASALAVADAMHAHTAEAPTLTVGGTSLVVADQQHAHAADAVALTLLSWLAVANALHAHTQGSVVLSLPSGPGTLLDAPLFDRVAQGPARRLGASSATQGGRRIGPASGKGPAAH